MKKWRNWIGIAAAAVGLAGCSSAYYASAGYAPTDDLYATHDRTEIARKQQAEAEARQAAVAARKAELEARQAEARAAAAENSYYEYRSEGSDSFRSILADDYESAYARRLKGFQSPTYRLPSSYYNFRYSPAFTYATAYDPAFYNIIISGDEVWVEPKYITSMFGTWGGAPYGAWYYGWDRPLYSWSPGFGLSIGSWGWSFGWNTWSSPWYDPWWGPAWGPTWGWAPGWPHHHWHGWGPGWGHAHRSPNYRLSGGTPSRYVPGGGNAGSRYQGSRYQGSRYQGRFDTNADGTHGRGGSRGNVRYESGGRTGNSSVYGNGNRGDRYDRRDRGTRYDSNTNRNSGSSFGGSRGGNYNSGGGARGGAAGGHVGGGSRGGSRGYGGR